MTKIAREFVKATVAEFDGVLAAYTPKEQHDLLDTLAGEIEERLDQLIDVDCSPKD